MPQKFHLTLLIHAHQPCGNFEHVLEKSYDTSYLPFIERLEKHPGVRLGLHYSGPLLTWIEEHRPEYFVRLKKLVQGGQVELVGGGFYEPILVSIPPEDQREQITRLAAYLEKHLGRFPSGAWLAERVWEPQLPTALATANVAYTLVDDIHFLPRVSNRRNSLAPTSPKTVAGPCGFTPDRKLCAISFLSAKSKTSSLICAMQPASTPAAWPPWAMTWKSSVSGPERMSTVTRMAGSPIFLPPWRRIRIGCKFPHPAIIWQLTRLSAVPPYRRLPTRTWWSG